MVCELEKKRVYYASFDYLRAIAIAGIMICHFLYNWYVTMDLGRFFGCTCNAMFIGISGVLLGIKWQSSGMIKLSSVFLKHRFSKLVRTYYPFLVLMFLFLIFIDGYRFNIKDIIMHLIFLPWFDKLPGFEHLWFITMIAICYISIYILSQMKYKGSGWKLYVVISVVVCIFHVLLQMKGLPGNLLLYLWLFILCFYHSNDFMTWCERKASMNVKVFFVILLIAIVLLFLYGLYDKYRFVSEWLGVVAFVIITIFVYSSFRKTKANHIVIFIAGISFELYLVHHVIAFGKWSITAYLANPVLGFATYILCSIGMAYLMKRLSNSINNLV